jgi:hypothetical protein
VGLGVKTPFGGKCSNHDQPSAKRNYPRMTINIGLKLCPCKRVRRRTLDRCGRHFT